MHLLDDNRKNVNISLRMLHLALQIIIAYWSVKIDGYSSCDEPFVANSTYVSYVMAVLNFIVVLMIRFGARPPQWFYFIVLIANLALLAALFYFSIEGYNKHTNCAHNKVLFSLFFIEEVLSVIFVAMLLFANLNWAERYTNWPGNLAWPLLFLIPNFKGIYGVHTLAIGIIYSIITGTSFIVNAISYSSLQFTEKKKKAMYYQWLFAIMAYLACQIYAIVIVATIKSEGDYQDVQARKTLVAFAGVNLLDFLFWIWGFKVMGIESYV